VTSTLDIAYLHISETKRHIDKLTVDLLSVTSDPETAEIHWLIATHPMKIYHFPLLPGFPYKGHWTQAN